MFLNHHRLLLLACVTLVMAPAAQAETQTFSLAAQWNLISFQVVPDNPDPEAVFSTLPAFQAAWTYDSAQGLWRRYIRPSGTEVQQANDTLANRLLALPPIEPGRAYWVFTSQAVPAWHVTGTVPKGGTFQSLDLQPGWNLIGIPVGAASVTNTEPVSLLAILTAAGFDYDAILTWESDTFRKMFRPQIGPNDVPPNPLDGLPPDQPFPAFNLKRDIGRGYWLRVLSPTILRPRLLATARPDTDSEPFGNFPAKEDINVSGGSEPATVENQNTIRFFPGEDVQTLSLSNLGDEDGGGGILLWQATWIPITDTNTPESWIRLFASPQERESRDENGQLTAPYTTLSGVTTLENDLIYLRLDRRNLGRGEHEGTLLLRTSVGDRSYRVVAEVPGLEGDFKGYAVIHSVNGKRNPIPDIDLFVSFYEDNKVQGLLRGLIDSSQTLLWPMDVPLVGYRVADEGNQFVLGGSFVLPPGDQNGEPFDQWNENDPVAGMDVDWLNDGILDVRNPFPFPIQRTVSMEGALIHGNPTDGYVLEGQYTEIVHGMSRQPIVLSGMFHLERAAPRPLSTRPAAVTDTGIEPVVIQRNTLPLAIAAGASRSSAVSIHTEMELQHVQVSLAFNAPLAHSMLRITLASPGANPSELVLYDGSVAANVINPKLLENLTFPLDRPPHGDLRQFLISVPRTSTEPDANRFWRLTIENAGPQGVTLANWSLRLAGQPVADVSGVVTSGGAPLAGARVGLDGLPFSLYSSISGADGTFTLSRVPLLPLNFSAVRPGYEAADPSSPGLSSSFTRPFVGQAGLTFTTLEMQFINRFNPLAGAPVASAGVPGFTAGTDDSPFELDLLPVPGPPAIAAGPLWSTPGTTVDFHALNTPPELSWDFGDGTTADQSSASHIYQDPGVYRVKLFSPASGDAPLATVDVIVFPAAGNAPRTPAELRGEPAGLDAPTLNASYPAYLFQPFFTFAGVIPARKVGTDPGTGADRYLSDVTAQQMFTAAETNAAGAAFVSMMPIQHMASASMDIDRAPKVGAATASGPFDSDGFARLSTPGFDSSINVNVQGFKDEDFNYAHVAILWQNTRAADGAVEYNQDAQNGLILWGNTLVVPNQNYSIQTFEAKDGADFAFALDDETFHPHRGTTTASDLATHAVISHYQIDCSMGAFMLTAPTPAASVKPAKLRRSQPDNPLDPALLPAPGPFARNLHYQLQTGLFTTPGQP